MKHHMSRAAFKELRRNLGYFLAHSSLRATLRPFGQFRGNTRGIIIVIVDARWINRYAKAAELLMRGDRRALFHNDASRRTVRVLEPSTRKLGPGWVDTLGSHHQLIILSTSFEIVPPAVRQAADVIVYASNPTPRQIAAGRRLAGLSSLPTDLVWRLSQADLGVVESFAGRQSFSSDELAEALQARINLTSRQKLSDLPGFASAWPWVTALKRDLKDWNANALEWSDVDHGAVLIGPPGIGKTLFAEALAAELGIPLVATSVAAWQGSGDGHLGDMLKAMRGSFAEARSKGCAILFVDELDGIGRRGSGGKNAYYESNVVNCFLELTDGLVDMKGVILIGATNRLEDVDPAVLRSGRLEEHIHLAPPDEEERAAILRHHLSNVIDVAQIRKITDRLRTATPADLRKLARRAKRTARSNGRAPTLDDVRASLPIRRRLPESIVLRMAVHECGHALVALASKLADGIVVELEDSVLEEGPDMQEGGRTHYHMTEEILPTEATLLARIRISLAGMAAEEVVQGSRSIGGAGIAGSDLDTATQIATKLVLSYGMGKSLRFHADRNKIDALFIAPTEAHGEISSILAREYRAAKELLSREKAQLMRMAAELVVDRKVELQREPVLKA
ncbi:AAA family ATPase [Rhizobium ruizarguesonis]